MEYETARLISRSCTTGWADWIHGELWLLPRHLVRRRLTLHETKANKIGRTVPVPLPEVPASSLIREDILGAHRTNKVVDLDEVVEARLHRGILTDRLAVATRAGGRHKLLWLKDDPAYEMLCEALGACLGRRLQED